LSKTAYLKVSRKKEGEEVESSHYPLLGTPIAYRPLTMPHLLKVPNPSPNDTALGNKPLTSGLLGDIPDLGIR
jgi:hypothetical protein